MLKCVSKVIQRPQLAQHFNCGGSTKQGTVLAQPTDKTNFMGTQCQKLLLRSSGLKGGAAYKAKKTETDNKSNVAASGQFKKYG